MDMLCLSVRFFFAVNFLHLLKFACEVNFIAALHKTADFRSDFS
jgi:hypothetical protein